MDEAEFKKRAYLFNTGNYFESYDFFGCHQAGEQYRFTVWAPHAKSVYLVGDFNDWEENLPLKLVADTGIWTITTGLAKAGDLYKFGILDQQGHYQLKIDPYAFGFEHKPGNSARVMDLPQKKWRDEAWLAKRQANLPYKQPLNIYEVHLGSWRKNAEGNYLSYDQIAKELVPYVQKMGYSHVEFMPLMEHLLDASWGYQLMGYFAPTSRFGDLDGFLELIEAFHEADIGVIMDWVPGHFIRNTDALAAYDGTPTYEYADYNRANNVRWGSWNFDLGKAQVQSFLISSAMFWLDYCHLDGLRVDAVSNMLYLDYDAGKEGIVNEYGNNANIEGQNFIKKLNMTVFKYHPDILMIAEESSAFPKVTGPVDKGGLGFNYKWNMGWMHDTLDFFEMDPLFRHDHFNLLTFSFMYMYDEQFVLPFSHDEVVHGKKSLMHKMPGDRYNQFANLRTMMVYMIGHPGKKLLFMGSEWGQFLEWRYWSPLEWVDLKDDMNQKMQHFSQTLNQLYHDEPALWQLDHDPSGMDITNADDPESSTLGFIRRSEVAEDFVIFAFNLVPVEKQHFKIPVPFAGTYTEVLNTEMIDFGGTWTKGQGDFKTTGQAYKSEPDSIEVILPAMSALIIKPKQLTQARNFSEEDEL
ncbi:glycogen branching enzyme [Agrilactobacillus composti DSM 18527 = JCM 14202]|uniref:1,4-alpha-glucan branching enzyme GlgB n=1 Tax=Agrilactobacillus composti DSM 18527 = JCM 14202 TaxID=1423734 RepID=X0QLR2_9LACO|nr:1,4-alpha-glucan branching protein GlgB [Agrilactobacillus composti]KRM31075.1 glycogen branching enzyme [Agrilactobacillus composti DSM 18527 = JCM 14202]GAF39545.1 1,4-alpha-glucan (glycogen) branching enzyme, GH-13-type [Agrilactobacillus composti DSM 18527 = JCM 14202]